VAAYGGDLAEIASATSCHTSEIVSSAVEHLRRSREMHTARLKCSHRSFRHVTDDVVAPILRIVIRVDL
jgi:hypothetical protein